MNIFNTAKEFIFFYGIFKMYFDETVYLNQNRETLWYR